MKVMRKGRILAKDHGDYVRTEREVLTAVFHPYIVTLRCSFQVAPPPQPNLGTDLTFGALPGSLHQAKDCSRSSLTFF